MEKHARLTSFVSLIVYVFLNFYFISLVIEMNGFSEELKDLHNLLDNFSHRKLVLIISVVTTVITMISLLVQYIIGKFLLIIFASNVKSHLFYALIPKILIMIINIIFIGIWQIHNSWFYLFTALMGSIVILLFFHYKKENWKASILFAASFIIDALFSLGKSIFSLL
ncbi:hypothetical protein KY305_04345 [Bacillus sp. YC2]|uniref:hypothetical protein n=1 Tax=Bacillus sp. YC2 TaxID=2861287 RepID=UPI001CA79FAF|nr:hypothetical protein [Bacillus sp. YC2]MBY8911989.1 hypothetical protein [Bacillus sp. YC2]